MDYLVAVLASAPLMLHFSFHHPADAESPAYVPRLLSPLGYFISVEITNSKQDVVYASSKPKIKLKLHPERPDSYLALDPGYTYGCALTVAEFSPDAGTYHASLTYSNQEFRGFPEHSLGEMTYTTRLTFRVD